MPVHFPIDTGGCTELKNKVIESRLRQFNCQVEFNRPRATYANYVEIQSVSFHGLHLNVLAAL